MRRWWGIRHVRFLWNLYLFDRWWSRVGSRHWLAPNEADFDHLRAIWEGRE